MATNFSAHSFDVSSDNLTPRQASDLLDQMVEKRVKAHKLHMMQQWERNHMFDSEPHEQKIADLKAAHTEAQDLLMKAQKLGLHVEVTTHVEIRLVSKPYKPDLQVDVCAN